MTTTATVAAPHPILSGSSEFGLARKTHQQAMGSDARREIAIACQALYAEGLMKGVGGHVSVRVPGERAYWINPHDLEFSEIAASDIVKVSFDGCELLEGSKYPSPGAFFHPHIYDARPDVQAIVHTHSPWATRLAILQRRPRMIHVNSVYFDTDLRITNDPLEEIAEGLGDANNALIPYHGVLSVGPDLGTAVTLHMTLEEAAHLDLTLDPDAAPMSPEDVDRVTKVMVGADYLEMTWDLMRRRHGPGVDAAARG
jgi:L-fuculose-phosphate aldolase